MQAFVTAMPSVSTTGVDPTGYRDDLESVRGVVHRRGSRFVSET